MPDDLLEQVLCFLPPTQALRCGRTSRAFLRAALTSLERAAWPADPGASCDYNCCRAGSNGNGDRGGRLVGTPCLDLREAGDAVDSRALLAVVGGIFSKPGGGSSNAPDGEDGDQGESGKSAAARKPAVLKGLAVRSADVQDEVRFGQRCQSSDSFGTKLCTYIVHAQFINSSSTSSLMYSKQYVRRRQVRYILVGCFLV